MGAVAVAYAITTIVANSWLLLTVTPGVTNLQVGESFDYTVTVQNAGSLSLNDVALSNALPAGLSVDGVFYTRGASDIEDTWINWSLGTLNTNKSAAMSVTATALSSGTWTNFFAVADGDGAAFSSTIELIQVGPVQTSPLLNVTLSGQEVILSWPQIAGAYHLETTTNLVPPASWGAVTNVPLPVSGQNAVTLPIAGWQEFFRLHSQ